jgi:hypothetical protein
MRSGAGSPRCVLADKVAMGPQIVKPGTPAQGPEVRSVATGCSLAVGEDERNAGGWGNLQFAIWNCPPGTDTGEPQALKPSSPQVPMPGFPLDTASLSR